MNSLLLLTVVMAAPAPAAVTPSAQPSVAKAEVTEAQKKAMQLLTDGKGHYLAIALTETQMPSTDAVFYGDGKTFYQLRVPSYGGDGGEHTWSMSLWEPRETWGQTSVQKTKEGFSASCGSRNATLTEVPAAEAQTIVGAAAFYRPRWTRKPYRLARDDRGQYYFVDHLRIEDEDFRNPGPKRDLRLFVGPRGKLKLQPMTNIVSDSQGDIFATKSGELRLVANQAEVKWVAGKKETKLLGLPIEDNARLIYTELGVYDRERLGTPCDDL